MASSYLPAHVLGLTAAGTAYPFTTLSFDKEIEEFETTHVGSNGDYECGVNVRKRSFSGDIAVKSDDIQIPPVAGTKISIVYTNGTNTHTADGYILKATEKGGGRGGFMISISGTMTGVVTES